MPQFRFSGADEPEPFAHRGDHAASGRPRRAAVGRILVVEDDPDLRETLADILQYEGYRVETAGNGQEGWARLASEPYPALILLDLMMPVMNGWDFRARQLRDPLLASIPLVVISAAERIEEQAALLSANGFLAKPIDVSLLIDLVSRFVS